MQVIQDKSLFLDAGSIYEPKPWIEAFATAFAEPNLSDYIAEELMKKTDVECRVTTLGHVQRGAPPTASDRILASAFGVYAVDLLNQKKFDRMVAWKDRKVVDVPIDEGISTYKNVERKDSLVETALSLDIYIGDEV